MPTGAPLWGSLRRGTFPCGEMTITVMRRIFHHILVLNSGSGSQKCSLFRLGPGPAPAEPQEPIWEATLDSTDPDRPRGKIVIKIKLDGRTEPAEVLAEKTPLDQRVERMLQLLWWGRGRH